MVKNILREGGKKFPCDACQRSTVVWQRIFLQKLQNGHKDVRGFSFLDNRNYSKVFFYGDQMQPPRRDFVLLYFI